MDITKVVKSFIKRGANTFGNMVYVEQFRSFDEKDRVHTEFLSVLIAIFYV